ncbi:MAG: PIN domain-containing protein [Gammaproteobacteria bacterium]
MKILLDTNVYAAFMRGKSEAVEVVRKADRVLMSTIVIGELLFGFRNGSRFQQNFKLLESFLANRFVEVVQVTVTTSDRFGRVAANLRTKGTPIPTNDIWIAAHTFETGADLLSYDKHFFQVDGLPWIPLCPD